MKPLCRETLSIEEEMYLGSLAIHPGFQVLKKLIADACQQATEDVIRLDPITDHYDKKLAALQWTARSVNDFASTLLKSVVMHSQAAKLAEEVEAARNAQ